MGLRLGQGGQGGPGQGGQQGPGGSSSQTISAGKVFNVSDGSTYLISKKLPYACSYLLYASPKLSSGTAYTVSLTDSVAESADGGDISIDEQDISDEDEQTAVSLSGAAITLAASSYAYTGSQIRPAVKSVALGSKTLTQGTDYTISYGANTNVSSGGTVSISGINSYTGTASKSFSITAKSVTPVVSLSPVSYVYSGSARKPSVSVKVGNQALSSSNYTVTYPSGRKTVGTYTVSVALKNNYTGSGKAAFTIIPKGTAIKKLSAGSKSFTVQWKKQASQTSGYQIRYSTYKSFKTAKTATITKTTTLKKTFKKLSAKKTYYVQVRTYKKVGSKKYYSAWSARKSVKTQK